MDVLSFGETMVLMDPVENGPLKYIHSFRKKIGGAESNVAIGLSRLGHDVGWFSKLGSDPHGAYIQSVVAGEGVDTDRVQFTKERPTGIMFKERISNAETRVHYNRQGSAASAMQPDELPEEDIAAADFLHVTGITPILSENCRDTVRHAFALAHDANTIVSFDPNVRMKLWEGEQTRSLLVECVQTADLVIISVDEGERLFDLSDPGEISDRVLSDQPETVAVTLEEKGAMAFDDEGNEAQHPGFDVDVVDTVGAGDAFCAGFLSSMIEQLSLGEALERANLCGALATTVPGDMEGLPTRDDLDAFQKDEQQLR